MRVGLGPTWATASADGGVPICSHQITSKEVTRALKRGHGLACGVTGVPGVPSDFRSSLEGKWADLRRLERGHFPKSMY